MKMPKETYEALAADCKAVMAATEQGLGAFSTKYLATGTIPRRQDLTLADMWDIFVIVTIDRSHASHPRHSYHGMLPRVLDHDDRSSHWAWDDPQDGGLGLRDTHIDTALRAIREELIAEPAAEPDTAAPTPSM